MFLRNCTRLAPIARYRACNTVSAVPRVFFSHTVVSRWPHKVPPKTSSRKAAPEANAPSTDQIIEEIRELKQQQHRIHSPVAESDHNGQKKVHIPKETLPKVTKEQLLAKATNFFSRIVIRFRWLVKKSNRPFNADDYSAFFSWLVMGNALLFFLATTTFVSLVILTANTVLAQEFVARKLGEFITKNSGLTVVFENAIVPGWSDGKISFQKCFVSKRPKVLKRFIKGSLSEAYAESRAREGLDPEQEVEDDGNYTQYDVTIEEVNITLSFNKWVNGTGIIRTMELKGLRGVVDRTHVYWKEDDVATNYKNVYHPGDFEFEDFKMEDVLFELKQPDGFRPFDVAIYNCEMSRLRKHWLFYDFLNANIMSGSYDNLLFTIHKKQRIDDYHSGNGNWKRITRLRIDSLNVDHLNRGLQGPFGWITSGKVDMMGDLMVPQDSDMNVSEMVAIVAESIRKAANRYRAGSSGEPVVVRSEAAIDLCAAAAQTTPDCADVDVSQYVVLDLTMRLNNVKASVPFQAPELSYINYALISPIVAYINLKNTFIEIQNRVVKNLQDFSGSWTVYDSLLMDDISGEVYDNFAAYVVNEEARLARLKKIGFWSLQVLLQVLVIGLGVLT